MVAAWICLSPSNLKANPIAAITRALSFCVTGVKIVTRGEGVAKPYPPLDRPPPKNSSGGIFRPNNSTFEGGTGVSELDTSVMVAFLPVEAPWVKQELPHMTLVFAGETTDWKPNDFMELMADTLLIASFVPRMSLLPLGVDQFGDGQERVDVLRLMPNQDLLGARRIVERWSKSQYTDYKPHVTIGPVGTGSMVDLPIRVSFDRVMLAWGDKHFVSRLYV